MRDGSGTALTPAIRAFDSVAVSYDERFGSWESVAAQRRVVRRALLETFPEGSSLVELGGGTGEDALFLARHGRRVLVTDGSPAMVSRTREKALAGRADLITAERVSLESFDGWSRGRALFDGAFSNFASLNCVEDRAGVARGLARLLAPGAHALLVVFGPFCPNETLVLLTRGRGRAAFRRLQGAAAPARLGGESFSVTYPAPSTLAREFLPWFRLRGTRGIGICVPTSAAEPVVSRFPRLLRALETLDRALTRPLALLGDHVLCDFERTSVPVDVA